MGSIVDKIQYTLYAVKDIKTVLELKGFIMEGVPLKKYKDYILELGNSSGDGLGIKEAEYNISENISDMAKSISPCPKFSKSEYINAEDTVIITNIDKTNIMEVTL